jgi:hypothetical protein
LDLFFDKRGTRKGIKNTKVQRLVALLCLLIKYFFNTTLGFVRWEYTLPNNEKIILQLK